ncbi:unnamed protein product [Paramecium sonneborni]|uniref:Uncharacterized protein n=1 Tax=Paramecium sonneborni TaxID=65129 RepID=A0A8S1M6N5_9CILI|nr:unnamed protein product [Paramecium sonneborni]
MKCKISMTILESHKNKNQASFYYIQVIVIKLNDILPNLQKQNGNRKKREEIRTEERAINVGNVKN